MPSLTKDIPFKSDLHKKLVGMLSTRIKYAIKMANEQSTKWDQAEDTILAYIPETDLDAKRRVQRDDQGRPKYTTIKLPYTYAVLMAMHTYLTSVFFARTPIHQFAGRHGEPQDQVDALEALIGYNVGVGEMTGPYYLWVYDACKYGVGVLEEFWDREEIQFSFIESAPDEFGNNGGGGNGLYNPGGAGEKRLIRVRAPGYEGNRVGNISPRDFFPDPRFPVGQFQKGEFVFVRKRLSWETILRRKAQGYYMNIDALRGGVKDFSGAFGGTSGSQLTRPEDRGHNELEFHDLKRPAVVPAYEGCISIVPSEWGLGEVDFPEKWMFTITADLSTVIGAQPHGAMHGRFPYAVIESEIEAYSLWNRGVPEIVEGVQNTLDWLLNQHFFNVRASLNNQFIIDPSKVVARDAERADAGFVWRLRPEAYGQDIRTFVHQIPVSDMTRGHVSDMNVMMGIGERITGINDQIMGVLAGGGRKTATEVRTSTGFGVNRQKTISEYMSVTAFSQHAQRLVQNCQQWYTGEKKLRLAGSLLTDMNPQSAQAFLSVTPEKIMGFYDFIPVDGTLPIDKLALANLWKDILLQMRSVPGLLFRYDLSKIFAHVANLAGIRNLNRFQLQLGSPEALMQQADAGNIAPIRPGGGAGTNPAGVGKPNRGGEGALV